jgi:hypothetical protein
MAGYNKGASCTHFSSIQSPKFNLRSEQLRVSLRWISLLCDFHVGTKEEKLGEYIQNVTRGTKSKKTSATCISYEQASQSHALGSYGGGSAHPGSDELQV